MTWVVESSVTVCHSAIKIRTGTSHVPSGYPFLAVGIHASCMSAHRTELSKGRSGTIACISSKVPWLVKRTPPGNVFRFSRKQGRLAVTGQTRRPLSTP